MIGWYLMFGSLLYLVNVSHEEENKVWSKWNPENNIKYGLISHPPHLRHRDAAKLCKSKHYHNLVTIRNKKESTDVENTIRSYRETRFKSNQLLQKLEASFYWFGSHRHPTSRHWYHYDHKRVQYTNWCMNFPSKISKHSCTIGVWKCSGKPKVCNLQWQNRNCDTVKGIQTTVCERRERRVPIDSVEKKLKQTVNQMSLRNHTENIAGELYMSTAQAEVDEDVVTRGIKVLAELVEKNKNEMLSELSIRDLVKTITLYQDFAFKNNSNFTSDQRQSVIKYTEAFVNNVDIPGNQTILKLNTSSIFIEVHYLEPGSQPRDYVYKSDLPESKSATLTVSSEAVEILSKKLGVGNKSRLSFVRFTNSQLFPSKFNSPQVVSAHINRETVHGLTSPITYHIPLNSSTNDLNVPFVQCAAWNFNTSSWSNEGCWLRTRNSKPECACNHMTNFALLVELFQRPSSPIFDTINLIVGSLSCIGFILVAIIYISFEKLRNSKPGPVHINLCCCYAIAYIIFLTGSNNHDNSLSCLAVTVLSHYFFLASWFWTFAEALTLYNLVVQKSSHLDEKYYVRLSLMSYLIPLIVVIINVGLTVGYEDRKPRDGFFRLNDNFLYNSSYVSNHACWLTSYSLYFGFLLIGGILLSMNIVIYLFVVKAITWSRRKIKSTRKESPTETFFQVVAIGSLTGLIWVLAIPMELLAMSPVLVRPVTYLFSILIAVQGIVIFYLFCVHRKRVRHMWCIPLWRNMKKYACLIFCCRRIKMDRFRGSKKYDMERSTTVTTFETTDKTVKTLAYTNKSLKSKENKNKNMKE